MMTVREFKGHWADALPFRLPEPGFTDFHLAKALSRHAVHVERRNFTATLIGEDEWGLGDDPVGRLLARFDRAVP